MVDFELIKGNISRYTLTSILKASHDLLVAVENKKDKQYPFWDVLVLIKWAYLYTTDSPLRHTATIKDVQNTMILISKFHEQTHPVSFKQGIAKGFKIIAYQQFWFQDSVNEYAIFRSYCFFNHIRSSLNVDQLFKSKTGIGTVSFLKSGYFLYLYFFQDRVRSDRPFDGILHSDVIDVFKKIIGDEEFKMFIQLISFSASDVAKLQRVKQEPYQLYETTLWNRYPLLTINGQKCFVHRAILASMLRYFIFDFLKKESDDFQTEVGERMEKYIALGLQEMKISVISEKTLKRTYNLRKVCDFLMEGNVLVECKAIGISPIAGIKRTKELLHSEFDSTLIKAYIQMLSTAKTVVRDESLYGIIITYRDTFTGFGKDAWEEFLEEPISAFLAKESIDIAILPPKRIVFITLEDWDRLVQLKILLKLKISEILDFAFQNSESGQVLFFEQVLDILSKGRKLPTLSYLEGIRHVFEISEETKRQT